MTTLVPPRGTRVETLDECAQIRATARDLTLREFVDQLCETFPGITRSWVKRHHERLMTVTTENMAALIDNARAGLNRDGLLSAQVRTISYSDPTGEHASNLATYGGGHR